jgi:hypothetical protein
MELTLGADMSLRKSPTRTPALVEANRRNAQKSTGPRTALGKAHARLNSLRKGTRSPFYRNLLEVLFNAQPCRMEQMAKAVLSPEAAAHPVIAKTVELFCRAEAEVARESGIMTAFLATRKMQRRMMQKNRRAKPECF